MVMLAHQAGGIPQAKPKPDLNPFVVVCPSEGIRDQEQLTCHILVARALRTFKPDRRKTFDEVLCDLVRHVTQAVQNVSNLSHVTANHRCVAVYRHKGELWYAVAPRDTCCWLGFFQIPHEQKEPPRDNRAAIREAADRLLRHMPRRVAPPLSAV